MKDGKPETREKQTYEPPKVLATYKKEELEETIKPHGPVPSYGGCSGDPGCGCGDMTFP